MKTMHATQVRRYFPPHKILADKRGSAQHLSSGNVLVYWGGTTSISEHTSDGSRVIFEAKLEDPTGYWYRAWKANFTTTPTTSPDVYATTESRWGPTVWYISWNGATEVRGWRLYVSHHQWIGYELIGYFEKDGFETRIEGDNFFAWAIVEAVDGAGQGLRNSSVPISTFHQWSHQSVQQSVLAIGRTAKYW